MPSFIDALFCDGISDRKCIGFTMELLVKLAKGLVKKQIEERTGVVLEG